MLSFDVEEYFHVEAAAEGGLGPEQWGRWPQRLGPAVDRILDLLAAGGATATFFILGWVARHEPAVVRRIASTGSEIASHGMTHRMLRELTPGELRRELDESRLLLEDLSGRPVTGYRAPTFSLVHRTAWALDVLAEAGYEYDSSVYPIRHDRYGVPDAPVHVHRAAGPGGGGIIEIPPLTYPLGRLRLPLGGGGYLRLLPARAVGWALRQAGRNGWAAMLYIHPWELDPGQPVLPMSRLNRFRHRVNLGRTEAKLAWLLRRFRFCSVREAIQTGGLQATSTYLYGTSG